MKIRAALAVRARAKSGLRALVEGSIISPRTCARASAMAVEAAVARRAHAVFNTLSAKRNLHTTMRLARVTLAATDNLPHAKERAPLSAPLRRATLGLDQPRSSLWRGPAPPMGALRQASSA